MRKVLKALVALVGLVLVLLIIGMAWGTRQLTAPPNVSGHDVALPPDSDAVLEGARIAQTRGCTDCHGPALGGAWLIEDAVFMKLPAPAIAGELFSTIELERAIRHGVGADGRPLIIMPSSAYDWMSDQDLGRLIAYVRDLPTSDFAGERSLGPIGRVVGGMAAGDLLAVRRIDSSRPHEAVTADYGANLAHMCAACHGADWAGGFTDGADPEFWVPNLTPDVATGLGSWTEADFERALRSGVVPDGRTLDGAMMPWPNFSLLTDLEVQEIWRHLGTVESVTKEPPSEN